MEIRVLSVKQPYAFLITQGVKDIENRVWSTQYRGPLLIHAGKSVSEDYEEIIERIWNAHGIRLPIRSKVERGGIVGYSFVTDCVERSDSPWFTGPYGFTLAKSRPLPFVPCPGKLGLFSPPKLFPVLRQHLAALGQCN